jgi:hypothetical protein
MARDHVAFPSVRSDQAFDTGVGLDHDRNAPQGAAHETRAARSGIPIFTRCGCESTRGIQVLHGAINVVVFFDPGDVPAHDLRDGVLVSGIEPFQPRDCDLAQVAIQVLF